MRPHHPHRRHSKIATFDGAVVEIEPSDGRSLLLNIARAILARILFIVHSLATIWQAVGVHDDNSVWSFALISVAILVEGGYAVIMRAGDERKWFSASVLLYILATAPPIWMLETEMCKWRSAKDGQEGRNESEDSMEEIRLQLLEQLLLVVLILNRWLLPKGRSVSREQLSQILLAYLAISSDIVEFFDVFKEHTVFANVFLQRIILYVWTLSLLQFPFVLTVSRARKMRLALTNEEVVLDRSKGLWQVSPRLDHPPRRFRLQDIPFLCVRLYLIIHHRLFTYTMGFFTCKNALIIFLQTYRAFVLINDRYLNPRLLEEPCRRPHSRTHRRPRHRRCLKKEESESQPMVTRT
ncbi:hypothetical protein QR680_009203 [Steinernema hermaphroditum]|uniref:Transmembrane protein 26 n=1 Tax=Steinernema hermaphroditum TaxID=289476 RepID=A0AA39IJD9_9BILA|nr:hypothetical protein QR680_009203 [Steinernema hermaphroditum]